MSKKALLIVPVVLFALAVCPPMAAEHHEEMPPVRMIVHWDHVKPSMTEEYEEQSRAWVEAFEEAGMGAKYNWHTSVTDGFTYVTVSWFGHWAEMDAEGEDRAEVMEAIGAEKLETLMAPTGSVASHHSAVATVRPELSYRPAEAKAPDQMSFLRVGLHTVKPGKGDEFEALMKKVVEAFTKAEHPYGFTTQEIEFGAEASFAVTVMAEDAATFYTGQSTGEILAKGAGPEAPQLLFDEWRNLISGYETSDNEMRHDLSYFAGAGE